MSAFREWSKATGLDKGVSGDEPLMVLFLVATVENEQPPEAAGRCVRFFGRDHAPNFLSSLHCAVFGLGDSNLLLDRQTTTAKDCNQVAQKLDKKLIALGATRFYRYGEADDRTGNAELQPWLDGLGDAVTNHRREMAASGGSAASSRASSKAEAAAARAEAEAAALAEKERIEQLASKWL